MFTACHIWTVSYVYKNHYCAKSCYLPLSQRLLGTCVRKWSWGHWLIATRKIAYHGVIRSISTRGFKRKLFYNVGFHWVILERVWKGSVFRFVACYWKERSFYSWVSYSVLWGWWENGAGIRLRLIKKH